MTKQLIPFERTDILSMQLFTTSDLDQLYKLRRLSRLTKTTAQFEFITKNLQIDHKTVKLFIQQQLCKEVGNVTSLEQKLNNRLAFIKDKIS